MDLAILWVNYPRESTCLSLVSTVPGKKEAQSPGNQGVGDSQGCALPHLHPQTPGGLPCLPLWHLVPAGSSPSLAHVTSLGQIQGSPPPPQRQKPRKHPAPHDTLDLSRGCFPRLPLDLPPGNQLHPDITCPSCSLSWGHGGCAPPPPCTLSSSLRQHDHRCNAGRTS